MEDLFDGDPRLAGDPDPRRDGIAMCAAAVEDRLEDVELLLQPYLASPAMATQLVRSLTTLASALAMGLAKDLGMAPSRVIQYVALRLAR